MQNDTPRAIAARLNGAKSKGPKSKEGKDKSSQNALKHGFTAQRWINLPGDEPDAFDKFKEGITQDLNPTGALQQALAERIVTLMWRLRRIPAMEARLVDDELGKHGTGLEFKRYDWPQAHLAIAKYESHLDRCLHKALEELRILQVEAGCKNENLQNEPKLSASEAVEMVLKSLAKQRPPPPGLVDGPSGGSEEGPGVGTRNKFKPNNPFRTPKKTE